MKKKSTLFNRIRIYVSNLWFRYVKNPFYYRLIVEPRVKREREAAKRKTIKDFEEKQKAAVSRIKEIMYHEKVYHENNPKIDYFNEKLIESRMCINETPKNRFSPLFYEPEICEIHNETIHNKTDDINKIILQEKEKSSVLLKKQELKLNRFVEPKPNKKTTFFSEKETASTNDGDDKNTVSLNQLREWDSEEAKLKNERFIKDLNTVLKNYKY
jgi:hypothetical protein